MMATIFHFNMSTQPDLFESFSTHESPTQADSILAYLKRGHSITPLEALERFGCMRLGARVWELKRRGIEIVSEMIRVNGKR